MSVDGLSGLEEWEVELFKKAVTRNGLSEYLFNQRFDMDNYRTAYFVQGNFTVATLVEKSVEGDEYLVFQGVTKRHPEADPFVPERGKRIALKRAVENAVHEGYDSIVFRVRYDE